MLHFPLSPALPSLSVTLLPQGMHLVLLLLDQQGLSSNDLLESDLGVLVLLLLLQVADLLLYLMSLCVLLLSCQLVLDALQVQ